jgi:hypothetical protein
MELSAFFDTPPPHLRDEEVGLSVDATDSPDHVHRSGLLARLYAWGPKLADWDHASQWEARWYFPFGNDARIRRTAPSAPPFASLDVARRLMGVTPAPLLLGRRSIMGGEVLTLSLHHGLPIQEITRVDGEPFPDIESATFEGGRWYIATNQNAGELPATLVYEVDGLRAREMARIPRLGFDGRPPPVKLTRHSDGSRLGLVVDGPPLHGRSSGHRWILPLSFRGGPAEIPKGLGASDFTDRPLPKPCSADASGWIFDASYNASPVRITHGGSTGTLQNVVARLRVTPDSICTEGLSGTLDPSVLEGPMKALRKVPNRRETLKPTPMDSSGFPALWVHASGGHARHALRCSAR